MVFYSNYMKESNAQNSAFDPTNPLACISLDLDNLWSYLKTHGDSRWKKLPSYLHIFIPHILNILDELKIKITFFVVGQDAVLDKNKDLIRLIYEKGHEIGNHSFSHEPWIVKNSKKEILKEILQTEDAIEEIIGKKPVGFRGPGYAFNKDLIKILIEKKYLYDASIFPTYIGPISRFYYFLSGKFTPEQKKERKFLFGGFKNGFMPNKPFLWEIDAKSKMLEIPITTMPYLKLPIHLSYLIYLNGICTDLMSSYLTMTLGLCKMNKIGMSFLLHPLDIMDAKQIPELAFFPGMKISWKKKIILFKDILRKISDYYCLVNMETYAKLIISNGNLKEIKLNGENNRAED